ncbi:MAG: hypothetical protein ACM3SQ_04630, partial [Betaproteobacteria bacterium]
MSLVGDAEGVEERINERYMHFDPAALDSAIRLLDERPGVRADRAETVEAAGPERQNPSGNDGEMVEAAGAFDVQSRRVPTTANIFATETQTSGLAVWRSMPAMS